MLGRIARTGLFIVLPTRAKLAWIGMDIARGKRKVAMVHGAMLAGQAMIMRRRSGRQARGQQAQNSKGIVGSVRRATGRMATSTAMRSVRSVMGQRTGAKRGSDRTSRQTGSA